MGLYERIKECATAKGYSINRLEKELGWTRSSICKFNTSTPGIDKINQLAQFLAISPDYLISGKDDSISRYTSDEAILLAKIAKNKELSDAFIKLTEMTEDKRNHVLQLINFLS